MRDLDSLERVQCQFELTVCLMEDLFPAPMVQQNNGSRNMIAGDMKYGHDSHSKALFFFLWLI